MDTATKINESVKGRFTVEIIDEVAIRTYVLKNLHGEKVICPGCGQVAVKPKTIQRFWNLKSVRCAGCERHFTATAGTIFMGTAVEMRKLYFLMLFIGIGLDQKQIGEILELSASSVRVWSHKLEAWDRRDLLMGEKK